MERIRYKIGYMELDREKAKIDKTNFGGKKNLSLQEANESLAASIQSGQPLSFIRMGISELNWVSMWSGLMRLPNWFYYAWVQKLFHNDAENQRFVDLMLHAYQTSDYMGNFYWSEAEGKLLSQYAPQATYCPVDVVDAYRFEHPWTQALAGKRVLVVHPFVETIRTQYQRKDLIYPNGLLPDFELITVPSVWYNADGNSDFATWFDALAYLEEQVDKETFDIALLGCGPFGVPLTAHIKAQGHQAIYVGGVLQVLFGIKGNRWDELPEVSRFYNEYWVRPGDDNKPKSTKDLDGNCYW